MSRLSDALSRGEALPARPMAGPGLSQPLSVRRAPPPEPRPGFLSHPRLRRASPISHFAVGAAEEALGGDAERVRSGQLRLGIVYCPFAGCVSYTQRFYSETLRDPLTASPLLFPETVFNAPASHLSAYFGAAARNYTLVGDQAEFLSGMALAAAWIVEGCVDGCLVVGAEEADWLTANALRLFAPSQVPSEGAGAIYLRGRMASFGLNEAPELVAITDPQLYRRDGRPVEAACRLNWDESLSGEEPTLFCDTAVRSPRGSDVYSAKPLGWKSQTGELLIPQNVLGEGLGAGGAWQVVAAAAALRRGRARRAAIRIVGSNKQAIGAVIRLSGDVQGP